MSLLPRTDRSWTAQWVWTVDRVTVGAVAALVVFGLILVATAGPAVAELNGATRFHFLMKHAAFLPFAIALLAACALLSPVQVLQMACLVCAGALLLTLVTALIGPENKGAQRWLSLGFIGLQPSEFLKPAMAVVSAWLFAHYRIVVGSRALWIAAGLLAVVSAALLLQPDVGMTFMVVSVWFGQFALAGMPLPALAGLAFAAGIGGVVAYFGFDHVSGRVNNFFNGVGGDRYQIGRSLDSFKQGGLAGQGPGEGTVKETLPDAHADFIFAVLGEEFGLLVCISVVALYGLIVCRGAFRLMAEENLFAFLAVSGLLASFGLQAFINMASALEVIPTKGTTLPFLSYGGSSLFAASITLGFVLALNRRRNGQAEVL